MPQLFTNSLFNLPNYQVTKQYINYIPRIPFTDKPVLRRIKIIKFT